MPTRFKAALWAPLLAAAAARGSPVSLDPARSGVEVDVKATIDSFVAQLQDYDACVTVAPRTGLVETAVFRFNFASVRTGNPDRDRDMNQWQQTARFPEVVFTLTGLEAVGGGNTIAHG